MGMMGMMGMMEVMGFEIGGEIFWPRLDSWELWEAWEL